MSESYKTGRLSRPDRTDKGHGGKYIITKRDGTPMDEDAQYFVLRVDKDPHARVALAAYTQSVMSDNRNFAHDLRGWLASLETMLRCKERHQEEVGHE